MIYSTEQTWLYPLCLAVITYRFVKIIVVDCPTQMNFNSSEIKLFKIIVVPNFSQNTGIWKCICIYINFWSPLQWRHNGCDCVSNHEPHDCLLNRLFRRRSKKISKLRVNGLCAGNSPHKWPIARKMFPFDDVIITEIAQFILCSQGARTLTRKWFTL